MRSLACAVTLLALAGCSDADAAKTGTVNGRIIYPTSYGTACGTGDHQDIAPGASVTITDADGTVIATTKLRADAETAERCVYVFQASNVPKAQKFYGVEIGERRVGRYPETQAFADELRIELG